MLAQAAPRTERKTGSSEAAGWRAINAGSQPRAGLSGMRSTRRAVSEVIYVRMVPILYEPVVNTPGPQGNNEPDAVWDLE